MIPGGFFQQPFAMVVILNARQIIELARTNVKNQMAACEGLPKMSATKTRH